MRNKRIIRRPIRKVTTGCFFCHEKREPAFLEIEILERFTSDRGKILGRDRTGNCQKHQRLLTVAIKRARYLALLPFINR